MSRAGNSPSSILGNSKLGMRSYTHPLGDHTHVPLSESRNSEQEQINDIARQLNSLMNKKNTRN